MLNSLTHAQDREARKSGLPNARLVFFLGFFALLSLLASRLLGDPDTFWHVAVGESIRETGRLPQVDTLSHTFAGAPWIAKEWLAQLVLSGADALAGSRGLAILTALTASACFTILFGFLLRRLPLVPAFAVLVAAIGLSAGQILARPQIFFFLFLTIWTCALADAVERGRRPPFLLVALMVLWANMHASFTFAFAVAGCLGLEALATAQAERRAALFRGWALFGAACLAAIGLTPYGFEPAIIAFRVFGSGEAIRYIAEWQPLGFDAKGAFAAAAVLAALAILAAEPRRNVFRLCLVALCAYLMVRHERFGSLFAIVAAILTASPLARLAGRLGATAEPAGSARTPATVWVPAIAATLIAAAFLVDARPDPKMAPAAALMAAREAGVSGNVYNDYDFGGFLIAQGVPTFVDGRSDQLFVGGFLDRLHAAMDDRAAFLALMREYGVGWALVRPDSREARILDGAPGWRRIYADEVAAVHARAPNAAFTGAVER